MVSPRISIIIRTMNRPEMLRDAIESAVNQTLDEIEILVCDDSADERSQKVAEAFADPRIRYFRHAKPLGAAGNSRFGLDHSTSPLVLWLDDDDALASWWAERALLEMNTHPQAVLCFGEGTPKRTRLRETPEDAPAVVGEDILMAWMKADPDVFIGGGSVYRRDAIPAGEPQDRFELAWDQALGVAVGRTPAAFVRVLAPVFWYREHPDQHSQLRSAALCRGGLEVLGELAKIERVPRRLYRRYYASLARGLARSHLADGNARAARAAAAQAWRIEAEPRSALLWLAGFLPTTWSTHAIRRRDARKSKWPRPQPS